MQNKEEIKKEKLLSAFKNNYPLLSKNGLKEKALNFFESNNFPGLKDEGWRQTNLSSIFNFDYKELKIEESLNIEKFKIPELKANILIFVNGFYHAEKSQIISNSIKVGSISSLSKENPELFKSYFESTLLHAENNFAAINTAFAHDGCFIHVEKNTQTKNPVHIINISTGSEPVLTQIRNLVITETSSEVDVIESFYSLQGENSFTNVGTEVIIGKNSKLNWVKIQHEDESTNQINQMKVVQQRDSTFTCNTITLSGNIIRNNIHVKLADEGCNTNLFGLYLPVNNELFDNYTFIEHAVPNCESNQVYKGIIDDNASAVFFGRVLVDRDAQKTNALQSNKNVLLSEDAKINSKPQLEIYADDVSCSHGSTTGQLDQESLFYLRSRGIPMKKARELLLHGFVSEVINMLKNENVKEYVNKAVMKIIGEE